LFQMANNSRKHLGKNANEKKKLVFS